MAMHTGGWNLNWSSPQQTQIFFLQWWTQDSFTAGISKSSPTEGGLQINASPTTRNFMQLKKLHVENPLDINRRPGDRPTNLENRGLMLKWPRRIWPWLSELWWEKGEPYPSDHNLEHWLDRSTWDTSKKTEHVGHGRNYTQEWPTDFFSLFVYSVQSSCRQQFITSCSRIMCPSINKKEISCVPLTADNTAIMVSSHFWAKK